MSRVCIRIRFAVAVSAAALLAAVSFLARGDAAAALPSGATAASGTPDGAALSRLLGLLALVPFDKGWDRLSIARYVDYRAAEHAGGVDGPIAAASLPAMDEERFDRWSTAMSRIALSPVDMSHELGRERLARTTPEVGSVFRGLSGILGIDWFEIDRSVILGDPADQLTILQGRHAFADTSGIEAALSAHDFARKDIAGVGVWHRFSDGEVRAAAALPVDLLGGRSKDPFGIADGSAARIAVLDDKIVGAPGWTAVESVIRARAAGHSLADVPEVRAAAEALADPGAAAQTLVQAIFLAFPYLSAEDGARAKLGMFATQEQIDGLAKQWRTRPGLPPYLLVALGDGQVATDEVAEVAVVYDNAGVAADAAEVLEARFQGYHVALLDSRFADAFAAIVTARVHVAADRKRAVVVVTFRSKARIEDKIADERPGRMFKALLESFMRFDVDPLLVELE